MQQQGASSLTDHTSYRIRAELAGHTTHEPFYCDTMDTRRLGVSLGIRSGARDAIQIHSWMKRDASTMRNVASSLLQRDEYRCCSTTSYGQRRSFLHRVQSGFGVVTRRIAKQYRRPGRATRDLNFTIDPHARQTTAVTGTLKLI